MLHRVMRNRPARPLANDGLGSIVIPPLVKLDYHRNQ